MTIFEGDSAYQEQIIEYKFLSDMMIELASRSKKLELMRINTDSFGYDLCLKIDNEVRYVQLKSKKKTGNTNYWDVHKSLLTNDNGIVLVISYDLEGNNLQLEYHCLDKNKYGETTTEKPKYKTDEEKFCKVSQKNLLKMPLKEIINYIFDFH